jgi:hypothetical protein
MNYFDYLKVQIARYIIFILSGLIVYPIACKLGWREPIVWNADYIVMIVSSSLGFMFGGALIQKWINSNNK